MTSENVKQSQDPPSVTVHGDDLAWLELMLTGAYPRGYGDVAVGAGRLRPIAPTLRVPVAAARTAAAAGRLRLLDPEGVHLADVQVTGWQAPQERANPATDDDALVSGVPSPATSTDVFAHLDHLTLRAQPSEVSSFWTPGPAVALWGEVPLTLAVREAARAFARTAGRPVLEVVPVPSGRDTDRVAQLPARLAHRETTRDDGDRAVLVPDPVLPWTAEGILVRAAVVAEYAASTLLVPPGRLRSLGARRDEVLATAAAAGVDLQEVAAHPGETRLDPRVLDAAVLSGAPLPSWFAEESVAAELRRLHRPRQRGGFTVLLSGLSGSGKSTVARRLAARLLEEDERSVSLLDGDVVRHHLSKGLGFGRGDRDTNVRRIGFVAAEVTKAGGIAIACPIAPYDAMRQDVRAMVEAQGGFVLVHVSTPLAECERRDRKGLYARARRGEIPEFTGISDPYEEPTDAEVVVDTSELTVDKAVTVVLNRLRELGYLTGDEPALQPHLPAGSVPRGRPPER